VSARHDDHARHVRRRRAHRKGLAGKVANFVARDLWMIEVGNLSRARAFLTRGLRVSLIATQGFLRDRCIQQSAALTYLTIFSLPALLAMVFAVAKGFKAYEYLKEKQIDAFLDRYFPVQVVQRQGADAVGSGSEKMRDVIDQVFTYVQNADLRALTSVGLVLLVYTTIKMLGAIEKAFNEIWGVQRARSLVRKLSDYLAIVVVAPLAMVVATAFTGFIQARKTDGALGALALGLSPVLAIVPILAICLGMTLVILTVPNTRVRLLPALVGGTVAGILWQFAQLAFVEFQLGLARVDAIFSSFAAVPLLLSWINFSWLTLFVGAELSFAVQNEGIVTSIARTGILDQRFKEGVAPRLAGRIAAAFLAGERPPTAAMLSSELGISPRAVSDVLEPLVRARHLARTVEEAEEGYVPARDPDAITVLDLLLALRVEEGASPVPSRSKVDERVDRILAGFEEAQRASLFNHTLRELARSEGEALSPSSSKAGDAEPRAAGESPA
jgi:membrane protein